MAPVSTTPPAPDSAGLTALVVDDEPPALAELAWLLGQDERIGRILTAGSGTDALRALVRWRFQGGSQAETATVTIRFSVRD